MYLLTDISGTGQIHIQSCMCCETIEDIKNVLLSVNGRWDRFAFVFDIFALTNGQKPVNITNIIWDDIKQYTYYNRNKQ